MSTATITPDHQDEATPVTAENEDTQLLADMEDEAIAECEAAEASVYKAAKAYIAVTEATFVQHASDVEPDDPSFLRIRAAADDLHDAADRQRDALASLDQCCSASSESEQNEDDSATEAPTFRGVGRKGAPVEITLESGTEGDGDVVMDVLESGPGGQGLTSVTLGPGVVRAMATALYDMLA